MSCQWNFKLLQTDYMEMTLIRCLCCALLGTLLLAASFPASAEEFLLRPSDTIQLKIAGVPANDAKAVTGEYVIDGQGYISLPNLGRIKIAGLTLTGAQTVGEASYRSHAVYTRPTTPTP